MIRRTFFQKLALLGLGGAAFRPGVAMPRAAAAFETDRAYWLDVLRRLADPVLTALAEGRLRAEMPVEVRPGARSDRRGVSHLEAFGRLLAGIAPWLALGPDATEEGRRRVRYLGLTDRALAHAVDPASPDFLNFTRERQPLVDAAFLAHALLRAPLLWERAAPGTREHLAAALRSTRAILPAYNNWILFSAMVEAALLRFTGEADLVRMDLAVRKMDEWYKGDGHYGDGEAFHWDYYNSYVIQPFLLDILGVLRGRDAFYEALYGRVLRIARRHAEVQERLISPEGTFPPIGRSITYRMGAFQLLAQVALLRELPEGVSPAQVRSALTAVMQRLMEAPGTFDDRGWLRLGLVGAQPALAEDYISTGSLYLCATALLPLGLPPEDPFWADPPAPWTAKRIWSGENLPADARLKL